MKRRVKFAGAVVPAVGGFAAGIAIVTLIGCIVGMVRLFIPF